MSRQYVVEKINIKKAQPPPQYQVILHNDDYTTMDFVIEVLMRFFAYNENEATQIMLKIHQQGLAVCGIYFAEIAEMKVIQVTRYAEQHQFPLRCTMEKCSS